MPKFTSNLYPQAFAFTESIIRQFGNNRNDLSRTSCVENRQNMLDLADYVSYKALLSQIRVFISSTTLCLSPWLKQNIRNMAPISIKWPAYLTFWKQQIILTYTLAVCLFCTKHHDNLLMNINLLINKLLWLAMTVH